MEEQISFFNLKSLMFRSGVNKLLKYMFACASFMTQNSKLKYIYKTNLASSNYECYFYKALLAMLL